MKYVKKLLGCHKKKKKKRRKKLPLPDNLGSWFSVYNLILTQLNEICKSYPGAVKGTPFPQALSESPFPQTLSNNLSNKPCWKSPLFII